MRWLVVFTSLLLAPSVAAEPSLVEDTRWVMGTHLRIVVLADREVAHEALDAAFAETDRWNALLSNYDPQSPLSEINAHTTQWVEIPQELYHYLERSRLDTKNTEGAFDITVGGRLLFPNDSPPVGMQWLQTELENGEARARLEHAGMALDPGGNGKGFAVDAVIAGLREVGIENALVDFGGSSWFGLGSPPEGDAWQVQVANSSGEIVGTVRLVNQALSTSAALRRDVAPVDGGSSARASHIVDPSTRQLVEHDRIVAVISPSALDAEVLSTALIVRGEAGLAWLKNYDGAGAILWEGTGAPVIRGESAQNAWPSEK